MTPAGTAGANGPSDGRSSGALYLVFALAALGLLAAISVTVLPGVVSGGLIETDGYMRLVRVERLWETGGWFDATLPRVNAPYGDTLHWTRPYDIVILLGAVPLLAVFPANAAIHWAAVASTPVLLVLACLLAVWAVRPLAPTRSRLLAMPVLFSQAGVQMVSLPGRADHHTLIILTFVLAAGALLRLLPAEEDPPTGAATGFVGLAGCALALGLWISSEFLVVWVAVLVALAVAWVAEGGTRVPRRARALLTWTAGFTGLFLLVERGLRGVFILEYDKISIAHVGVMGVGAGIWSGILVLSRRADAEFPRGRRIAAIAVAGAAAAGVIALLFPGFLGGPWAELPPEQREFWYGLVREYRPVLPVGEDLGTFVALIGPVCLGCGYTLYRLAREWGSGTWWPWLLLTSLFAFYLPLGVQSLRFAPLAQVPAALALVPALDALFGRFSSRYPQSLATALNASATIAMLGGFIVLGGVLTPDPAATSTADAGACRLDRLAEVLERPDGLGSRPRIILSHQDYSAELLYRTRHAVVATSFHRNVRAVWEVRDVLTGSDEIRSRQVIDRRGVDLILLCPDARGAYFRPGSDTAIRQSLYGRLVRGEPPTWLRRVPLDVAGTEGFLLFEVVRQSSRPG